MAEHGWTQDAPAYPDWCTKGADHVPFQVYNSGGDYWHRGNRVTVMRTDETPNCEPIPAAVETIQRVQIDERGYCVHPMEVELAGMTFTPENARMLAAELTRLADLA